MTEKAVVLSSGGIDSTTAMAMAKDLGLRLFSLSFDYGQRHRCELDAARRVATALGAERHLVLKMDLAPIGGSALTDAIDVPKGRALEAMGDDIPVTYVPARNTIFLSYGLAWAEVLDANQLVIGVNALDYSGYPDCRPAFIAAFQAMANLATKAAVQQDRPIRIFTPLIRMTKAEIIRTGTSLGVDYGLTFSCYDPTADGLACGQCDSCLLRRKGFQEAGVPDPTRYMKSSFKC
ncbi:7-cyano-7-deazaguanine synthase QueC [Desulfatitalea alkaliphila]|uniref:7-cyano-7-deazaguanine synthase n=1 Tax=Desulfatitalea alkaliphila TaxID=2929485 RepID=A0AA41R448_9BACT|nr:7-cyano-7-deazaguanine synthase QueC [Desulfatitalea alkaliphila]MCJ8502014.1 7-cyano-7-deazaguanine synthase QueC [Desulfatitalea alkaliphila]